MKMKKLFVAALVALSSVCFGANVVSTGLLSADGGATDTVVRGAGGSLLTSGYAGTGKFSISDVAVTAAIAANDFALLSSTFVPFIGTDNFQSGNDAAFGFAVPGNYFISIDPLDPTPHIGATLYTFLGDGASLGGSANFALFRHGQTLAADGAPPALPTSYGLGMNNGTLLFGEAGTSIYSNDDLGIAAASVRTVTLAPAIPEPSVALLGLLGAVGFFRRRR